jgi:hypothetical protein
MTRCTPMEYRLFTNEERVMTNKNLDFNNSLYYLLMDHASRSDDAVYSNGVQSVDQLFDQMFDEQDDIEPMQMTTKRGTYND